MLKIILLIQMIKKLVIDIKKWNKKTNLKIFNELKNQADDIRTLYQEFHNIDNK